MKVKICGVCRPQDAQLAAAAGADYIGVILAPNSRRTQTPATAAAIFASSGTCQRVGVFADQSPAEVCDIATSLRLDILQLHGNETSDFAQAVAERCGCAVWKTVWLHSPVDLEQAIAAYAPRVHGLLLDGGRGPERGGTGATFDWSLAAPARRLLPKSVDLIVAGGLSPANVKHAIATVRPDIVDVASGVERALCQKSPAALHAFVRNAKS